MTDQDDQSPTPRTRLDLETDNAGLQSRNASLEQERSDLRDANLLLQEVNSGLRLEVSGLEAALSTNREIGAAVGIVMERLHVTQSDAFAFLVRTSQNLNVRLSEVADRIIHTGDLSTGDLRTGHSPHDGSTSSELSH